MKDYIKPEIDMEQIKKIDVVTISADSDDTISIDVDDIP